MWMPCDVNLDYFGVALVVVPAVESYLHDVGVRVVDIAEVYDDGLGYAWSAIPDELDVAIDTFS